MFCEEPKVSSAPHVLSTETEVKGSSYDTSISSSYSPPISSSKPSIESGFIHLKNSRFESVSKMLRDRTLKSKIKLHDKNSEDPISSSPSPSHLCSSNSKFTSTLKPLF